MPGEVERNERNDKSSWRSGTSVAIMSTYNDVAAISGILFNPVLDNSAIVLRRAEPAQLAKIRYQTWKFRGEGRE